MTTGSRYRTFNSAVIATQPRANMQFVMAPSNSEAITPAVEQPWKPSSAEWPRNEALTLPSSLMVNFNPKTERIRLAAHHAKGMGLGLDVVEIGLESVHWLCGGIHLLTATFVRRSKEQGMMPPAKRLHTPCQSGHNAWTEG